MWKVYIFFSFPPPGLPADGFWSIRINTDSEGEVSIFVDFGAWKSGLSFEISICPDLGCANNTLEAPDLTHGYLDSLSVEIWGWVIPVCAGTVHNVEAIGRGVTAARWCLCF